MYGLRLKPCSGPGEKKKEGRSRLPSEPVRRRRDEGEEGKKTQGKEGKKEEGDDLVKLVLPLGRAERGG